MLFTYHAEFYSKLYVQHLDCVWESSAEQSRRGEHQVSSATTQIVDKFTEMTSSPSRTGARHRAQVKVTAAK